MNKALKVPPFNWQPPEWDRNNPNAPMPDLTMDPNNQAATPVFNHPNGGNRAGVAKLNGDNGLISRLTALKARFQGQLDHVDATRALEPNEDGDQNDPLTMVPHPKSDFHHVDPGVFDGPQTAKFVAAINALVALQGPAGQDGETDEAFKKVLPPLRDLAKQMSPNPKGMQRLKLVSDNTLVRVTILLGEMNDALSKPGTTGKPAYNNARDEYIALLKDLDDREPDVVAPGNQGYGSMVKWTYVRPIIHQGQIKGAEVQAKWNPHISSSGIPIPHD